MLRNDFRAPERGRASASISLTFGRIEVRRLTLYKCQRSLPKVDYNLSETLYTLNSQAFKNPLEHLGMFLKNRLYIRTFGKFT